MIYYVYIIVIYDWMYVRNIVCISYVISFMCASVYGDDFK